MLQQITPRRGRRTTKFTPANIQKIKDWVAQGIPREEIAKSLGATVGSLQVTCSRLGISLRIPKIFDCSRAARSTPVLRRPNYAPTVGHMQLEPQYPRLQVIIEHGGVPQATDVPLTGLDVARLGLEASLRNLGMTQLLTQAVATAIKKDLIDEILRGPSQEPAPQVQLENPLSATVMAPLTAA